MLRAGCGAARGGGCPRGCAGVGRAGSCAASRGAGRLCPPPPGPHCHPVTSPLLSMQHPVPWGSPAGAVGRRAGAGAWGVGAGWCMGRAGVSVLCQSPSVIKGLVEGTAAAVPSGVPPHASAIAASCTSAMGGSCLGSLPPGGPQQPPALPAPLCLKDGPQQPPAPSSTLLPPQHSGQGHGCSRVTVFIFVQTSAQCQCRAPPVGSSPHGVWLGQGAAARAPTPLRKAGVTPLPKPLPALLLCSPLPLYPGTGWGGPHTLTLRAGSPCSRGCGLAPPAAARVPAWGASGHPMG